MVRGKSATCMVILVCRQCVAGIVSIEYQGCGSQEVAVTAQEPWRELSNGRSAQFSPVSRFRCSRLLPDYGVDLMPDARNIPSAAPPAPDVPLDQTKGPIYYGGGAVQRDIARLWRRILGLFATRNP